MMKNQHRRQVTIMMNRQHNRKQLIKRQSPMNRPSARVNRAPVLFYRALFGMKPIKVNQRKEERMKHSVILLIFRLGVLVVNITWRGK